jgi:hypothetical protein
VLDDEVTGSISPALDYDYFRVTLPANSVFEVLTNGNPNGDTVVAVFDQNGTLPFYGCDDDAEFGIGFFYSHFLLPAAGDVLRGCEGVQLERSEPAGPEPDRQLLDPVQLHGELHPAERRSGAGRVPARRRSGVQRRVQPVVRTTGR